MDASLARMQHILALVRADLAQPGAPSLGHEASLRLAHAALAHCNIPASVVSTNLRAVEPSGKVTRFPVFGLLLPVHNDQVFVSLSGAHDDGLKDALVKEWEHFNQAVFPGRARLDTVLVAIGSQGKWETAAEEFKRRAGLILASEQARQIDEQAAHFKPASRSAPRL